jgi:thiol:disulfide interchange protein
MSAPVLMTTLFVGGLVAIPTLGKWAQQVTEALAFLLAVIIVMGAALYLCERWPDYYANPQTPVAATEPSGAD